MRLLIIHMNGGFMTAKEVVTKFRQQLDEACVRHAYKKDTQMVALESITLEEARILRDECDIMLEDIQDEEDCLV